MTDGVGAADGAATMAEGRVADIVGQAERFCQVLVEAERPCKGSADLGHFQAMGQPNAKVIAVRRDEDLRLVAQAPERHRMDDAVPVPLKGITGPAGLAIIGRMEPAARAGRV